MTIQPQHDPAKRIFDILFSLCFLSLLSPLFAILAILVKLTSKGPILYKSLRMGRGGKPIACLKFRSMYEDADKRLHELLKEDSLFRKEWKVFQKVENDPRITPLGNFLRKTSLDEIPQFWNVLKGNLSVVGPRPPTLLSTPNKSLQEITKLYGSRASVILSVRPGITGVWQISGRSQIPFKERCLIEEKYAKERTFLKDLIVIAKTLPVVFSTKGAV